jgi:hypothetical protein
MKGKTRTKWDLFLFGKRRDINLLEGSQVLPACPSDIKSNSGLEWPRGFQKVKVPRLRDNNTGWR